MFGCMAGPVSTRVVTRIRVRNWEVYWTEELRYISVAHYIVRAKPKAERLAELKRRLGENAFVNLRPFGKALTHSLNNARIDSNGTAIWEEEDYCSPPLDQERAAVLDAYFEEITVEPVNAGEGWARIENLPKLRANF
jgi:hypothetical protein